MTLSPLIPSQLALVDCSVKIANPPDSIFHNAVDWGFRFKYHCHCVFMAADILWMLCINMSILKGSVNKGKKSNLTLHSLVMIKNFLQPLFLLQWIRLEPNGARLLGADEPLCNIGN